MWMYWFTALLDDIESESKEDLPAVDEEVTEPAAAAAETAAAETASAMDAPDVIKQSENAEDVVKQKREVNRTADADVRTL